ncbi:hypothetical protein CPB84DRAFT_1851643 [Gymnopilus junonius]|uniref:Uncharacterized protein n=1 Tax=Gymnopilus junonius TaxID=109634 RepID=A0A9P5NF27_GYMJU|nr:hypothetical protein CPB84DRAFT_1851643 [Gymnopilus junonius]
MKAEDVSETFLSHCYATPTRSAASNYELPNTDIGLLSVYRASRVFCPRRTSTTNQLFFDSTSYNLLLQTLVPKTNPAALYAANPSLVPAISATSIHRHSTSGKVVAAALGWADKVKSQQLVRIHTPPRARDYGYKLPAGRMCVHVVREIPQPIRPHHPRFLRVSSKFEPMAQPRLYYRPPTHSMQDIYVAALHQLPHSSHFQLLHQLSQFVHLAPSATSAAPASKGANIFTPPDTPSYSRGRYGVAIGIVIGGIAGALLSVSSPTSWVWALTWTWTWANVDADMDVDGGHMFNRCWPHTASTVGVTETIIGTVTLAVTTSNTSTAAVAAANSTTSICSAGEASMHDQMT